MLVIVAKWVILSTLDCMLQREGATQLAYHLADDRQPNENSRPFVTSSVFSTAIEACENKRVKKGRPHAAKSMGRGTTHLYEKTSFTYHSNSHTYRPRLPYLRP